MILNTNNEVQTYDKTHPKERGYRVVLSIAGSDSLGGAGIQADIKTFSALGIYGATAITAITAQNTQGVDSQFAVPTQMVHDQIVAVMEDIHPSVIKIGMLSNAEIAERVADTLRQYNIPIILDPVMVSTSGHRLLSNKAQDVIKQRLLPMTTLVTPNIPEMEALTDMSVTTYEQKRLAAEHLFGYGVKAILLKGGHEAGDSKSDTLFIQTPKGIQSTLFTSNTIATRNTHGTGCTLSAAIAAHLATGLDLSMAIGKAKEYITEAIKTGSDISIGFGNGPVNHGFNPQKMHVYERE